MKTRSLIALAAATLALAAPAAASAQPLTSVAILTDASGGFLALDVVGGSTEVGAKVIQYAGSFGSNQRWNFVKRADGAQQIVNQRSGMCLTTNGLAGSQLYQWTCNGGPRQVWNGDLGMYGKQASVLTNPSTGLRVDIEGDSALPGARAIGWYANGSAAQRFLYVQFS